MTKATVTYLFGGVWAARVDGLLVQGLTEVEAKHLVEAVRIREDEIERLREYIKKQSDTVACNSEDVVDRIRLLLKDWCWRITHDGSDIDRATCLLRDANSEIERLRENWLTEQKARLEDADVIALWSVTKIKAENKRLQTALRQIVDQDDIAEARAIALTALVS